MIQMKNDEVSCHKAVIFACTPVGRLAKFRIGLGAQVHLTDRSFLEKTLNG
jgi:hypothetical protein